MKKFFIIFIVLFMSVNAYATTYYRGDSRDPRAVKAAGGLYPQGSDQGIPSAGWDMSLYQHVHGSSYPASGVVSTSLLFGVASTFIQVGGYVYFIQGDANLVDTDLALGPYVGFPNEREFSAIGGIPWRQVRGWRQRVSGPELFGPLVRNPDYAGDAAFSGEGNSNPAQVVPLAGFPAGHPAFSQAPWNQYPFNGCGSSARVGGNATSSDQCEASERSYEWKYLSQYKATKGIDKKVIPRGAADSSRQVFPTSDQAWVDMDGNGYLSLCGLFYDSEGSRTRITCLRNKDGSSFQSIRATLNDYGWTNGRAFTLQSNGKAGFCRLIYVNTHLACAITTSAGYFGSDTVSSNYIDGGYDDSRAYASIYENGSSGFCRVTGNSIRGFYINCDHLINGSQYGTFFYTDDPGWADSRMWLDIKGEGKGHDSYCRMVGTTSTKLQCALRSNDSSWRAELVSSQLDGGYAGYRFPVRMGGAAQEYCRVTGGYYDYLTCTYLDENNKFINYAVALPRYINSSTRRIVSFADVDGDGRDDLCFLDAANKSIYCYLNKGRAFNGKAITLKLRNKPVSDFSTLQVKIMPINYTSTGPVASVCYNSGSGWMSCDKFMVY